MSLELLLVVFFILQGLMLGSFLNVCIWRIPQAELSINSPSRSFCPRCKSQLSLLELVPILSWLLLGCRCYHCRAPIPARYSVVEALTAVGIVGAYLLHGLSPTALLVMVFYAISLLFAGIEFDHGKTPEPLFRIWLAIGLGIGVVSTFVPNLQAPVSADFQDAVLGATALAAACYLLTRFLLRIVPETLNSWEAFKAGALSGAFLGIGVFPWALATLLGGIVLILFAKRISLVGELFSIPVLGLALFGAVFYCGLSGYLLVS